jgi:putative ubiquitin-RnfH superfamily antitoxin RatB of RatAB toxin-antitoxin module
MAKLTVEVVYALRGSEDVVTLSLPAQASVADAVAASGMAQRHPEVDFAGQKFGIYGKRVAPETALSEGDRIEIYRELAIDPKEARRRRALAKR